MGLLLGLGLSLEFNSSTLKSSAHVPTDLVATRGITQKPPFTLYNVVTPVFVK